MHKRFKLFALLILILAIGITFFLALKMRYRPRRSEHPTNQSQPTGADQNSNLSTSVIPIPPKLPSPNPEDLFEIKLLNPRPNHCWNLPKSGVDGDWLALLPCRDGKSELKLVHVTATGCNSPDDDARLEFQGIEKDQKPIILFRGLPDPKPRTLLTENEVHYAQSETAGFPQLISPIIGIFSSTQYTFTSEPIQGKYEPNYTRYRVIYHQGKIKQTLFENIEGCPDCDWAVLWCGDLDGDGFPDFLISHNPAYLSYEYRLYLSSMAKNGEAIGLGGFLDQTSD